MEENDIGNIFDVFDETDTSQRLDQSIESPIENPVPTESNTEERESDDFSSSFTDELSVEIEPDTGIGYQLNEDESGEPPQVLSTVDSQKDDVQPFDGQKIQADKAMNQGKKPRALNKQGILYIILGVMMFVIVFGLFIFPLLTQRKRKISENAKKKATVNESVDYYALAHNEDEPAEGGSISFKQSREPLENKLDEDGLPPVNPKYTDKKEKNTYVASGGSSIRKEIPDTSEDALQGKSINGIKGISSSRKNYLTGDPMNEQTFATPSTVTQQSGYLQNRLPNQTEYTNQLLSQYSKAQNSYAQQNDQSGKNSFFSQGRGNISGSYLPLNSIWQGTIFTATLTSNINTDLPGECTAVITKNVYSSQDGALLLIPQNSKLLGSYNSSISYSQSRVQVGWHTLIRPDGYQVSLGNMNTTDSQGASGLKGFINDHPFQYLKALALMSAFSIATLELKTFGASAANNQYIQQLMNDSLVISNRVGEKLLDRALDVQPTITIKSGTKINIVANHHVVLPPFEMFEVTQPYHKQ